MRAGLAGGGAQSQDSDTMGRDQRDMVSDQSTPKPAQATETIAPATLEKCQHPRLINQQMAGRSDHLEGKKR
jgi:hypothetical protein